MFTRFATAASLLALSTTLAFAQAPAPDQSAAPKAGQNPATTGTTPSDAQATKEMKEWQVAKVSKVSLAQALQTAESQGEKGRAIDADFEKADSKNPNHYSIKVVYPDGKLVEYGINADTGALYKSENQPIERYFTRLKTADFQNAKTSLKDAIALAEKHGGGGKAYEAEVEREGSAVQYEISVALANRSQEVKIGPDGKILEK